MSAPGPDVYYPYTTPHLCETFPSNFQKAHPELAARGQLFVFTITVGDLNLGLRRTLLGVATQNPDGLAMIQSLHLFLDVLEKRFGKARGMTPDGKLRVAALIHTLFMAPGDDGGQDGSRVAGWRLLFLVDDPRFMALYEIQQQIAARNEERFGRGRGRGRKRGRGRGQGGEVKRNPMEHLEDEVLDMHELVRIMDIRNGFVHGNLPFDQHARDWEERLEAFSQHEQLTAEGTETLPPEAAAEAAADTNSLINSVMDDFRVEEDLEEEDGGGGGGGDEAVEGEVGEEEGGAGAGAGAGAGLAGGAAYAERIASRRGVEERGITPLMHQMLTVRRARGAHLVAQRNAAGDARPNPADHTWSDAVFGLHHSLSFTGVPVAANHPSTYFCRSEDGSWGVRVRPLPDMQHMLYWVPSRVLFDRSVFLRTCLPTPAVFRSVRISQDQQWASRSAALSRPATTTGFLSAADLASGRHSRAQVHAFYNGPAPPPATLDSPEGIHAHMTKHLDRARKTAAVRYEQWAAEHPLTAAPAENAPVEEQQAYRALKKLHLERTQTFLCEETMAVRHEGLALALAWIFERQPADTDHPDRASPALQAVVQWGEEYMNERNGRLFRPFTKTTTNLSLFNDFILNIMASMETAFQCNTVHATALAMWITVLNAFDPKRNLKNHMFLQGPAGTSKSFPMDIVIAMSIPGTTVKRTYQTAKSDTATGNADGSTVFMEEASDDLVGIKCSGKIQQDIFKSKLTSGLSVVDETYYDECGRRNQRRNTRKANCNYIMATNIPPDSITPEIKDRFFVVHSSDGIRMDRPLADMICRERTEVTLALRQQTTKLAQWMQYCVAMIYTLISCGVLPRVRMTCLEKAVPMVMANASKVVPNTNKPRPLARLIASARTMVIMNAALKVFASTTSPLADCRVPNALPSWLKRKNDSEHARPRAPEGPGPGAGENPRWAQWDLPSAAEREAARLATAAASAAAAAASVAADIGDSGVQGARAQSRVQAAMVARAKHTPTMTELERDHPLISRALAHRFEHFLLAIPELCDDLDVTAMAIGLYRSEWEAPLMFPLVRALGELQFEDRGVAGLGAMSVFARGASEAGGLDNGEANEDVDGWGYDPDCEALAAEQMDAYEQANENTIYHRQSSPQREHDYPRVSGQAQEQSGMRAEDPRDQLARTISGLGLGGGGDGAGDQDGDLRASYVSAVDQHCGVSTGHVSAGRGHNSSSSSSSSSSNNARNQGEGGHQSAIQQQRADYTARMRELLRTPEAPDWLRNFQEASHRMTEACADERIRQRPVVVGRSWGDVDQDRAGANADADADPHADADDLAVDGRVLRVIVNFGRANGRRSQQRMIFAKMLQNMMSPSRPPIKLIMTILCSMENTIYHVKDPRDKGDGGGGNAAGWRPHYIRVNALEYNEDCVDICAQMLQNNERNKMLRVLEEALTHLYAERRQMISGVSTDPGSAPYDLQIAYINRSQREIKIRNHDYYPSFLLPAMKAASLTIDSEMFEKMCSNPERIHVRSDLEAQGLKDHLFHHGLLPQAKTFNWVPPDLRIAMMCRKTARELARPNLGHKNIQMYAYIPGEKRVTNLMTVEHAQGDVHGKDSAAAAYPGSHEHQGAHQNELQDHGGTGSPLDIRTRGADFFDFDFNAD